MSDFNSLGVGVDIEEVEKNVELFTKHHIFTKDEIEYCFSKKNYAAHLAARYCAKEACLKAVCSFGYDAVSYADFEVYHAKNGAPEVRVLNPGLADRIELKISISHSKTNAICYALANKKHLPINYLGDNIYGNAEI